MGEIKVIDRAECGNTVFEVLEYSSLEGSSDPSIAQELYYAQRTGIRLRQVKITLKGGNSSVITEAGALNYYKGRIVAENSVGGLGGFAKKFFNSKVNGEKLFRPSYRGRGDVFLEPSFNHFALIELNDDELIVDKGMFFASAGEVSVDVVPVGSVSAAIFGSDGLFQTRIRGTGVVAVEIPVPFKELVEVELYDEVLKVDGDFALMFSGNLEHKVTLGNRGLIRTWTSQEHLLETFEGTGVVWLAPTNDIYKSLSDRMRGTNMNTGDVLKHVDRENVDKAYDN